MSVHLNGKLDSGFTPSKQATYLAKKHFVRLSRVKSDQGLLWFREYVGIILCEIREPKEM